MTTLPRITICIATWNGERFLKAALDSIRTQSFSEYKVLILDNMSTDSTQLIAKSFADSDYRFTYILDVAHKGIIEAQKYLLDLVDTEYVMIACDDDIYHHRFLELLINTLDSTQSSLAYSNTGFVDESGRFSHHSIKRLIGSKGESHLSQILSYGFWRNPIPIFFGVYRTNIFKETSHAYRFVSKSHGDHDNLFLFNIICKGPISYLPETLFWYREQDRTLLAKKRAHTRFQVYSRSPILIFFSNTAHEMRLHAAFLACLSDSPLRLPQLIFVASFILLCLIYRVFIYPFMAPLVVMIKRGFAGGAGTLRQQG